MPGSRTRKRRLKTNEDLRQEIRHVWNYCEVKIIPIVIGALGTVSKGLIRGLEVLDLANTFNLSQKVCLTLPEYSGKF